MAETIVGGKWQWHDVVKDLKTQGGLGSIKIVAPDSKGFIWETEEGIKFSVDWKENDFLLVTMSDERKAIVDAFAKVVGYRPFCKYIRVSRSITFEWCKNNQKDRFLKLKKGRFTKPGKYACLFELQRIK